MVKDNYIPEMTWKEIEAISPKVQVAVIPTGSIEQHGPHLPLQSDTAFCLYMCRKASELVHPIAIVTPPISVGISTHHMKFTGSLTLRPETFIDTIYDFAWSLKKHGVSKIVIVNGHGGNMAAIKVAARKIMDELGLTSASLSYWELLEEQKARELLVTYPRVPGHACEFETSLSYVIQPKLVRENMIGASDDIASHPYEPFFAKIEVELSKSGVSRGDPRSATPEKGKKLVEVIVEELAAFLKMFGECGDRY
ncbi:MAG: creatininase family protein [Nitrososphaeria archaeon]